MNTIRWLSQSDMEKTGICQMEQAIKTVKSALLLYHEGCAKIAKESALYLDCSKADHACYALPAYLGAPFDICGVKWTSHGAGEAACNLASRIQAAVILNDPKTGIPIAMMNSTTLGALRTGAVTAIALEKFAPKNAKKAALCGLGGQGEYQLRALAHSLPQLEEIALWSPSGKRGEKLKACYENTLPIKLTVAKSLEEAVDSADVLVGATSAPEPYLKKHHLSDISLYCHIGFHEIDYAAIKSFSHIVVDTWEDSKTVSGQSLFRAFRDGVISDFDISATLGEILSSEVALPEASRDNKVMFDAFGLPIFDISLAYETYMIAKQLNLGTNIDWF